MMVRCQRARGMLFTPAVTYAARRAPGSLRLRMERINGMMTPELPEEPLPRAYAASPTLEKSDRL